MAQPLQSAVPTLGPVHWFRLKHMLFSAAILTSGLAEERTSTHSRAYSPSYTTLRLKKHTEAIGQRK